MPQKSSPIVTAPDFDGKSGNPTAILLPKRSSPHAACVQIFENAPIPQLLPTINSSVALII